MRQSPDPSRGPARRRVAIVNAWSDDNKGDAAILSGLVTIIRDAEPLTDISIVSSIAHDSRSDLEHSYRFLLRDHPDVELLEPILPSHWQGPHRWNRKARRLTHLVRSFLVLLLAPRASSRVRVSRSPAFQRLAGADLVLVKGGHAFFSSRDLRGFVGLYTNAFHLLLAGRLSRPTAVFGQSIGPINGAASRALARLAFGRCLVVASREALSAEHVRHVAPEASNTVVFDTAFMTRSGPEPSGVVEQLQGLYLCVTVRQWHFPYDDANGADTYAAYLEAVVRACVELAEVDGLTVVVVAQVVGPTPMEDDRLAMRHMQADTRCADFVFCEDDLGPGELMALYGGAEIVLGTRFHSVILALAAGTPAVAIGYHGTKAKGVMADLGLGEYCIDIQNVEEANLARLARQLLASRADVSLRVIEIVEAGKLDCQLEISELLKGSSGEIEKPDSFDSSPRR